MQHFSVPKFIIGEEMNKRVWTTALKSYAAVQRRAHTIPNRNSLSAEEEWHCCIMVASSSAGVSVICATSLGNARHLKC
jgi:hypothetical protein